MKSLVRGFVYPDVDFNQHNLGVDDFFPRELVAELRVDASPLDVLKSTIFNFKISNYLGASPWLVSCGGNRTYLEISELKAGDRIKAVTISDLVNSPELVGLKRKNPLTREGAEELAARICHNLMPENYFGIGIPRSGNVSRVYSDVLSALGYDVSYNTISDMLVVQGELLQQQQMRDRIRRAEDWNSLAGKVVGAEA